MSLLRGSLGAARKRGSAYVLSRCACPRTYVSLAKAMLENRRRKISVMIEVLMIDIVFIAILQLPFRPVYPKMIAQCNGSVPAKGLSLAV